MVVLSILTITELRSEVENSKAMLEVAKASRKRVL
jgi:hypothetical protein